MTSKPKTTFQGRDVTVVLYDGQTVSLPPVRELVYDNSPDLIADAERRLGYGAEPYWVLANGSICKATFMAFYEPRQLAPQTPGDFLVNSVLGTFEILEYDHAGRAWLRRVDG